MSKNSIEAWQINKSKAILWRVDFKENEKLRSQKTVFEGYGIHQISFG